MKETAAQYSDPFAKIYCAASASVGSEDLISRTRQTQYSLTPATLPQKMGFTLSLTLHSMKISPSTIRRMWFSRHCFLFPPQKTVKHEEDQKSVMSYSNAYKCEAVFTRFYYEIVKYSETWKEKQTVTHMD